MTTSPSTRLGARLEGATLLALAAISGGAACLVGLIGIGGPGVVLAPVFVVLVVVLYRQAVSSIEPGQTRAVVRDVGAGVLALGAGFGMWVAFAVLGVMTGVLPFITYRAEDHPFMDEWEALSVLAGVVAVPVTWWLLRRWADRSALSR